MGPNGPRRRHRQANQSHSGEATSAGFPGMTGAVREIRASSLPTETARRQALAGIGTVRYKHGVHASTWTGYLQNTAIEP